jgi:hypothetical protein
MSKGSTVGRLWDRCSVSITEDLSTRSVASLLAGYAATLAELKGRGVVRTENAPAGDYAEWLVAKALDGTIAGSTSEKSWDIDAPGYGPLQVKCRLVSVPAKAGQLQTSAFRSWEFRWACFVMLSGDDYSVTRAALVPVSAVRAAGQRRDHVGGWIVQMRPSLLESAGAEDITERLRAAALE